MEIVGVLVFGLSIAGTLVGLARMIDAKSEPWPGMLVFVGSALGMLVGATLAAGV